MTTVTTLEIVRRDIAEATDAAILGWRVIHVTPAQVNDWTAFGLLERILA